jgi:hypothetical protein
MTSSNHSNSGGSGGDTERVNPDNAATDTDAAAVQDQIKADAQALRESARRVEASLPEDGEAATDPNAAAIQDEVRASHDELEEQARRVEASVPAAVRDTPVQPANTGTTASEDTTQARRNVEEAHEHAEAARAGAQRVKDSLPNGSNGDDR